MLMNNNNEDIISLHNYTSLQVLNEGCRFSYTFVSAVIQNTEEN